MTDTELLQEAKKSKPIKIYDAIIVGVLAGIAIYSSVANGFGLLTFLPFVYVPIAAKNQQRMSRLRKQLSDRGLNLE